MFRATQSRNLIVLSIISFVLGIDAGNRRILPTSIKVREGEDVQVHFLESFEDEISCYVKTPNHVNCNLKLTDVEKDTGCERIHYWSINGTCGFSIANVRKEDSGWWRLTSKDNNQKRIIDIADIKVLDKFQGEVEKVDIVQGYDYTLSFSNTEYCMVQNPHDKEKTILNSGCSITMPKVSTVDQGNWSAIVGVEGQIEEAMKIKDVSVFQDHLDYGYTVSSNPKALHLFCNLISQDKVLIMCRFTRAEVNQVGLRLYDGLRKGRYGYHGNGLAEGECGLTIESPEEKDYGHWYCMVHTSLKQPYAATIQLPKPTDEIVKNAVASSLTSLTSSFSPIITTKGEMLKLQCFTSMPLSYCRFSQPNGEAVTSQATLYNTEQHIDISLLNDKTALALGSCTITIEAKEEHNGTWTCYMGPASLGMELSHQIAVRIAETSLAAVDKFVFRAGNDTIILKCKTIPRAIALAYCRFYSPDGFGININEHITKDNPIERNGTRYWYNGKSIIAGDCGLVIEHPSSMDNGNWTCAAKLELFQNETEEFDTIHFAYETASSESGIMHLTAGAATGIGFAVITVLIVLGFLAIIVKKKWHNRPRHNQDADSSIRSYQEFLSLNTISTSNTNTPRHSNMSNNSSSNSDSHSSNSHSIHSHSIHSNGSNNSNNTNP